MTKLQTSLYDPAKTYEHNFEHGPFGAFSERSSYRNEGESVYDFFGVKVHSPFGIAAGPLPGAHFVKSAFDSGFDIATFKSVRTRTYPCHPMPNVMPVAIAKLDPYNADDPIYPAQKYEVPFSLANSYGIPSFGPEVWQPEVAKASKVAGKGQAVLIAFQGTDRNEGHEAFIEDHVEGVRLIEETGAQIIEINLSCPNEGSPRLLCFDAETTKKILERIRSKAGTAKLIVKITYFSDKSELKNFVKQVGPLVDGITAINTVAAKVVNKNGEQAFPGTSARAKPGISGQAIKHLAREMVVRLKEHREEFGLNYRIIGVGGVQEARDFHALRRDGADIVMSVTGAMWNPELAAQIKATI